MGLQPARKEQTRGEMSGLPLFEMTAYLQGHKKYIYYLGQVYYALVLTRANLPRTGGAITAKKLAGVRDNGGPRYFSPSAEDGRMQKSVFTSRDL